MNDIELNQEKVIHKKFGEGSICQQTNHDITVDFLEGQKQFSFPDAFGDYLTLKDKRLQALVMQLKADKEDQRRIQAAQELVIREANWCKKNMEVKRKKNDYRNYGENGDRPCIVFKMNFCDGGKTSCHLGYCGVCSDGAITYNIEIEHRAWCSAIESPCRRFYEGEIPGEALDAQWSEGYGEDFVCYESRLCRDWIVNGKQKLRQVQVGHLCVLTTRIPIQYEKTAEDQRSIIGFFIVAAIREGDEGDYLCADESYRMEFTPKEARHFLFWQYHRNLNQPDKKRWGTGLYRYFDDIEAVAILRAAVDIKQTNKGKEQAEKFLQHYCEINGITIDSNETEK